MNTPDILAISEHCGFFHMLAIVTNPAVNMYTDISLRLISVLLGICLEVELLDYMVILIYRNGNSVFKMFEELPYSILHWLYHFVFLPTVHEDSSFSTSSPAPTFFCLSFVFEIGSFCCSG